MNAVPGPNWASTSPASAGPKARAPVNCMPLSRTALTSASGGTSCGTNACQAAMVIPEPIAPTTTQSTMSPGEFVPPTQTPHSASALSIMTTCETSSTVRREWRSASDPASGPTTVAGKNVQKAPTPTHTVEWVNWSSTNGTVMV